MGELRCHPGRHSAEEIDEATVRRQLNVKLRTASAHPQLAVEYGPRGIRANTILPGAIRTRLCTDDWARSADPAAAQAADESMHLQHRMGEPAEIAAVVSFLLSAESSLVNGQEIVADGGATARRPRG